MGKASAIPQKKQDLRHCGLDPQSHSLHVIKKVAFTLAEGASHGAGSDSNRKIAARIIRGGGGVTSDRHLTSSADAPLYRKFGFTLAEVLITLGIIGVVAAMTLPTLIAKYEKKQTAVAVKKVYSELCQVIQRAEADYGDFKSWKKDGSLEGRREFVNTYIKPYYKGYKMLADGNLVELWDKNTVSSDGINGILSNGTIISIAVVGDNLYVLIDVNGFKKPNKMGRDIFYFNTVTGKLMPSGWQSDLTREMALNGYTSEEGLRFSCKKSKTNDDDDYTDVDHACTSLLMLDGWEFKDDYPW